MFPEAGTPFGHCYAINLVSVVIPVIGTENIMKDIKLPIKMGLSVKNVSESVRFHAKNPKISRESEKPIPLEQRRPDSGEAL